jgi:hypothetical protein
MTTEREKGQLQPLVWLLSVAFGSVSVFFLFMQLNLQTLPVDDWGACCW